MNLAGLAIFIWITCSQNKNTVPEAQVLLRECEEYRSINCAVGRVRCRVQTIEKGRSRHVADYDITFDDWKLRSSVRFTNTETGRSGYVMTYVLGDEGVVSDGSTDTAVHVFPLGDIPGRRKEKDIFYPRAIGMSPKGRSDWVEHDLHSIIGSTDWSVVELHPDLVDGVEAVRILLVEDLTMDPADQPRCKVWIATNAGRSLLRADIESEDTGGNRVLLSVRSEYRRWPDGDVWFPLKSVAVFSVGDNEVRREEVDVQEAQFGKEFTIGRFDLSSFGLSLGRPVVDQREGSRLGKWNGTRVVWPGEEKQKPIDFQTKTDSKSTTQPAIPPAPARNRLVSWVIVLTTTLGLFVILFLRKR